MGVGLRDSSNAIREILPQLRTGKVTRAVSVCGRAGPRQAVDERGEGEEALRKLG